MSNSRSLGALKRALGTAMDPRLVFHAPVWGDPQVMSRALRDIRKDLVGAADAKPSADVMQAALARFYESQTLNNFTDLKYVCYGVTVPIGKHQVRLIDRRPLFSQVLSAVEELEAQPKQFRRCYQGLLSAYFGFSDSSSGEEEDAGPGNWRRLRGFLGTKFDGVRKGARQRGEPPAWLELLGQHRNLLGEDPCAPYAGALANGDTSGLRAVCEGLGIPSSSWVWDDALMAYVRLVCSGSDTAYKRGLPGVLDLVNDRIDLRLPQRLATRATALTVARYSKCEDRPEHGGLRDTALEKVGNPWLARSAWDAEVKCEPARQMVDGWLKRRLITDFFELLAQDGGGDVRRLKYWLKWAPHISGDADMWFILGSDARRNPSPEFKAVRNRMAGRDRILTDSNAMNNAFVMRIGPLLVIEFGITGHACYVFAADEFMTDLDQRQFTVKMLRQRAGATRLAHSGPWEARFDEELGRLLHGTSFAASLSQRSSVSTSSVQANDAKGLRSNPVAKPMEPTLSRTSQPLPQHVKVEQQLQVSALAGTRDVTPAAKAPSSASKEAGSSAFFAPTVKAMAPPASTPPVSVAQAATVAPLPPSRPNAPLGTDVEAWVRDLVRQTKKRVSLSPTDAFRIASYCRTTGLTYHDFRAAGGVFWVQMANKEVDVKLAAKLASLGFRFEESKGFWFRDEK